jgi:hypothetical protein
MRGLTSSRLLFRREDSADTLICKRTSDEKSSLGVPTHALWQRPQKTVAARRDDEVFRKKVARSVCTGFQVPKTLAPKPKKPKKSVTEISVPGVKRALKFHQLRIQISSWRWSAVASTSSLGNCRSLSVIRSCRDD